MPVRTVRLASKRIKTIAYLQSVEVPISGRVVNNALIIHNMCADTCTQQIPPEFYAILVTTTMFLLLIHSRALWLLALDCRSKGVSVGVVSATRSLPLHGSVSRIARTTNHTYRPHRTTTDARALSIYDSTTILLKSV